MENSLSAFRAAVDEGYQYVETDVHVTADGVVVVSHDALLDRTTDATGPIARLPWRVVRAAKIGGREEVVPLAAVLEELPDTFFNIDVKTDAAVEPVIAVLDAAKAYDRVCLASFSERRLNRLRLLAGDRLLTSMGPRSVLALLAGARLPGRLLDGAMAGLAAQVPLRHGLVRLVSRPLLRAARKRGLEVHVWTIDVAAEMHGLLDAGVDGLVTDAPDTLRAVLRERGMWR